MESQTKENRRDLRLELADRLIQQIESGTAPWQRDWEAGEVQPPVNAITGKPYRGVNYQNLLLFSPDPSDNRWATYKQAEAQGWQVRKGEHGISIEKWSEFERKLTEAEKEEKRAAGLSEVPDTEKRFGVKYYTVFHASQIDGIPPIERPDRDHELEGKPDPRIEGLAEAMGVEVRRGGSKAFYRPGADFVQIPMAEDFHTAKGHDTVFLHELSHATGHESRLSREISNPFGSEKYALEELRAEMSAAMTAAALGIGFDPAAQGKEEGRETETSAAYLAGWLKALPDKDRKQILMQVIKDAQGISDYLLERTPEIDLAAPEQARTKEADKDTVRLILTHRKDLKEQVEQDLSADGTRMEVTRSIPVSEVKGRLLDFAQSAYRIETENYGPVWVETGFRLGEMEDPLVLFARESMREGRTVALTVSEDGKTTTLEDPETPGRAFATVHERPARPFALMDDLVILDSKSNQGRPVSGKLVEVYAENQVELMRDDGTHVYVGGPGQAYSPELMEQMDAMRGRMVEVGLNGNGRMQVVPAPEIEMSAPVLSTEKPVPQVGDRIFFTPIVNGKPDPEFSGSGKVLHIEDKDAERYGRKLTVELDNRNGLNAVIDERFVEMQVLQQAAEIKAPEAEKPRQDLQALLGSIKGKEISLHNGKVVDAYQYLDQGLKRGYDIQVGSGKDGEIRWANGEKVGGLVPEALAPVLRSAQPEAGKSLGDTLRAEMAKMQSLEVSKAPQKKAAALEIA